MDLRSTLSAVADYVPGDVENVLAAASAYLPDDLEKAISGAASYIPTEISLGSTVQFMLFFAAAYCLLRVTVAHSMPYEGSYHIGPRQQNSAIILGGMSVLLF